MYQLYLNKCEDVGISPVKESLYWTVFNEEYNIKFSKPKTDTVTLVISCMCRLKVPLTRKARRDWRPSSNCTRPVQIEPIKS